MLAPIIARFPTIGLQFWRPGASSRKTLERILKNQYSSDAENKSCPPRPKPPKCSNPDPSDCVPPGQTSPGREKGQPELTPCDPDCRAGKPNLPPRGCLPWERRTELCPGQEASKKVESASCEHICEPYAGQEVIDKLKISVCEFRRVQKCLAKHKDIEKCKDLAPKGGITRKEYPMAHAVQKMNVAGCPITSHHFVKPKNEEDC